MKHCPFLKTLRCVLPAVLAFAAVVPVLAGAPLICSRFDIGTASSLPWNVGPNWNGMLDSYDRSQLTTDTLALLTKTTPILVRMETLRRATLYATTDKQAADRLLVALLKKVKAAGPGGDIDALSLFDAGYLVESYKQATGMGRRSGALASTINGRAMVERSLAMRGGDPAIAFAASLMTEGASHANHLRQAQAGAKVDQLLAKNLSQLGHRPGQPD
jgi:hypothetical protein